MIRNLAQQNRMRRQADTRIVRVGQDYNPAMVPPPMSVPQPLRGVPGVGHAMCPTFPSSMKYMSATTASLAMGASETLEFTTPGAFCPMKMIVTASVDVNDVDITAIESGLEDQVISGPVPAGLFSLENDCCPVSCLKCLCAPGVPLRITVTNGDAMAQTVTVTFIGAYLDVCPPAGSPYTLPNVPGCPNPGSDKLVGFELSIPSDESASVEITTPGRFCPRALFLAASIDILEISIENIQSGLKDQIISGALPAALFSLENECCILACFDCLCAPGYPLTLTLHNVDAMTQVVRGVLVGDYTDACP